MAAHELPAAVHDHLAADLIRSRALQLIAELDTLPMPAHDGGTALIAWAGSASVILKELARG